MASAAPAKSFYIRLWALALLLCSCALFVISRIYHAAHPIWPWIEAFSEAAMVGALADWFAVSALFRHPLGIPIPHTAIIPRNQGRIAGTLGRFVQDNFLNPVSLSPRLQSAQLGQKLVAWLSDVQAARTVARQLRDLLLGVLQTIDNREVSGFIARSFPLLSARLQLAPLVAEIISSAREGDRNGVMFNEVLGVSEKLLQKHKELLESLVSKELPWYIPGFIKHHLYAQVSEAVRRTLAAMRDNPDHIMRQQLTHLADKAISELRINPLWEKRLQDLVVIMCQKESLMEYLGNLKDSLIEGLSQEKHDLLTESLETVISFSAQSIARDKSMTEKLDQLLASILLRAVRDYGGRAGIFIEETMRSWDSRFLVDKIEAEVGRDLQFIRINGTIVGGIVGLLIHLVTTTFQ